MHLLLIASLLFAQDAAMTNLTISGAEAVVFTDSDTNACYFDDDGSNGFSVQLTDPSSGLILSMHILGTVGDHPAKNQLTGLSLDGPEDDPFVNWSSPSGTVTLDDVAATVPIEGGDATVMASTHGVRGHIDADMTSKKGDIHVSGPFACHSPL